MIDYSISFKNYYESINDKISRNIDQIKENISKYEEQKRKATGREADKIQNSIDKELHEKGKIEGVRKALFSLNNCNVKPYVMSEDLIQRFESVGSFLDDKSFQKLTEITDKTISNIQNKDVTLLNADYNKTLSAIKYANYGDTPMHYDNPERGEKSVFSTVSHTLENGFRDQKSYVTHNNPFIHKREMKEIKIDSSIENRLYYIEKMINENKIDLKNSHNKKIINEFSNIQKAYESNAKAKEYNMELFLLRSGIREDERLNEFAKPLYEFINSKEKENRNLIFQSDKFIEKFDFSYIDKAIDEQQKQEQIEKKVNDLETQYLNLFYELEKLTVEKSPDHERIQEIQSQIKTIDDSEKIDVSKCHELEDRGRRKYHNEIELQKEKVKENQAKAQRDYELNHLAEIELKSAAIKQLKEEGKTDAEIVNHPELIKQKEEELKQYAFMTPEQRGLNDMIKSGRYPAGTKFEDLPPSLQNNIRYAWRDDAFNFVVAVKRQDARDKATAEEKKIVNDIYKEYLKYRASLENKKEFLTFKAYAAKKHDIQNINVNLVDEYPDQIEGYSR